jgi:cytochrome c oxidase assembly protein subunit 11
LVQLVTLVVTLIFTTIVVIPPFYDWFCRVTGFGGATAVADAGADTILDRTIKVRFDASLEQGMPWTFRPVEHSMTIRIGETGLAFYEAHNPANRPVAGTASFNVYPYAAGGYFTKIECFCFQEQVLQPGETVQMPVSFYVDPAIVDDPDGMFVQEIVLSYTFHETPLPEEQAALTPSAAPNAGALN